MKTSFKMVSRLLALCALVSVVGFVSCESDEVSPVPEEVTNPLTEEVYYVVGVVSSADGVLADVSVTYGGQTATTDDDGVYVLEMSSPENVTLTFSKSGYVSVEATAIFASEAIAGSTATLSQELTALEETQTASAGVDSQLTFGSVTLDIPAGAISEDIDLSTTVYTPAAAASVASELSSAIEDGGDVTVASAITAIDLQPDGTEFDSPITVYIPSDYVSGAYHAKWVDGEWVSQGSASYSSSLGAYAITVSGFSQHSIAAECSVSVSEATTETIVTETIDNFGNTDAVETVLTYEQNAGWEVTSGDSSSSTLMSYAAGILGSSEGVTTLSQSRDVAVAGDESMTITVEQQIRYYSFSFGSSSISVTSYGDVTIEVVTEQGDLRVDHNY